MSAPEGTAAYTPGASTCVSIRARVDEEVWLTDDSPLFTDSVGAPNGRALLFKFSQKKIVGKFVFPTWTTHGAIKSVQFSSHTVRWGLIIYS